MSHISCRGTIFAGVLFPLLIAFVAPAPGADPGTKGALAGLIETAPPASRSFTVSLPWFGRVEARSRVELRALVAGRVTAVATEGAPVQAGALLLQLGGPALASERAGLQTRLDTLKTRRELQQQTLTRLEQSLQDQLATRDQLATARENLAEIEGQQDQARRALADLERNSRILAPVAGRFSRTVSVGQDVAAGALLGTLVGSQLRIVARLYPPPATDLSGLTARVATGAGPDLTGVVSAVLPETDAGGATRVWIEGAALDTGLRPGQEVAGTLLLRPREGVLAVPASALVYDEQEHPLVLVRAGADYAPRPVETGQEQDGWVEIRGGLAPGQTVVIRGAYELYHRDFGQQYQAPD